MSDGTLNLIAPALEQSPTYLATFDGPGRPGGVYSRNAGGSAQFEMRGERRRWTG